MNIKIKPLTIEEYDKIIQLWRRAALPYKPQGRDTRSAISEQISRSPDLFLGAFAGETLIGVIIGSDDGRKGWINRLAVDPDYQRQGLAGRLVEEIERELRMRGRRIIAVLVESWNGGSLELFQRCGYILDRSILYLSKRDNAEV